MKKLISILLASVMLCTCSAVAFAKKVGDVIGYATYTDIVAYINHYPITSYNVNDHTVVVAEDLRNYGFNVEWNESTRSLHISRSNAKTITPYGTVYKYASKKGQRSMPYLETDIRTYINGSAIPSYNIDGKTVVNMEDLNVFGEVIWVPETRALKMWIEGLPHGEYKVPADISSVSTQPTNTTSAPAKKKNITTSDRVSYLTHFQDGLDYLSLALEYMKYYVSTGSSTYRTKFGESISNAKTYFTKAYNIAAKYDDTTVIANKTSRIISYLGSMTSSGLTRTDSNGYLGTCKSVIDLCAEILNYFK